MAVARTGLSKGPGSGAGITALSQRVSVFYSNNDSTLKAASSKLLYGRCHNKDGRPRLGFRGPTFDETLDSKVVGIDCSSVVDGESTKKNTPLNTLYTQGWIPEYETGYQVAKVSSHASYRYVPQILWVIAQALNRQDPKDFYGLEVDPNHEQSYTMTWDKPAAVTEGARR